MYPVTQSQASFISGGKSIRLDSFLPSANGKAFPAVVALHGSGGGHTTMSEPATLLARHGFAVYVLHYFDRTGTTFADKQTIFRNFPLWMKTLWDGLPKEMKLFVRRIPPVLILHGESDPTVPVEEAYHLQQVLEGKGVPYEMQIYPGIGHSFTGEIWRDAGLRTLAFLKKHLGQSSDSSGTQV
ncbi:MAG: hypothetical protein DMG74_14230 [Acidobacteria bacterium]|nr:MAG: hypothetical protein DMG74_14230 [Acidobacteriota bacterium]